MEDVLKKETELSSMSVNELLEYAKSNKIDLKNNL